MAEKGNKYSVYQGLDTDPSINWGTVASTISDQLTLLREAKIQERDAIDKATQDQMDQLNKLPDVNDRSLSKIVLEASDRSKEYLRREMDLVKRGLRKPKDYSLFMQSQKNGYSDFGNVVKNWDKWNTAKQEAITNGTQSDLDMFTAEDIESFGNLKNKTVMTNPANGQIQVVSMGLDKDLNYTVMPNAGKNPEAFANPGSINARMRFDEKRKDTTALVTAETAEIARIVEAGRAANGVVTTMEDYRQSPSFDTWKRETTAKLTSNVYDTTQVLTQSGYVLGRTEAEARKKWESQYGTGEDAKPFDASKFIKVNMSGEKPVPQLSESQVNAAKDIVGNKIESQLDSIQSKTQGYDQNSSNARNAKEEEDNKFGRVKAMNDILSADNSQDAINRIDTDPTYENVESMQMVDADGNNVGEKDWLKAKEIKIDYYDPKKGEMTQGTVRLFDDNGNKKSSDKIVMDMVEKLGIPTEQLESYKRAFKKKKGTFNSFKGIANYKRAGAELVETGTVQVDLGNKKVNVSQGVSNVLKENFKDENIDEFEAILTDNTQTLEEKELAEDKLDSYRWSLVTSMVNKAVKPKLRGKGFKLVVGENGALSIRVGTEDIDLGLTKGSLQNDGSLLMTTIEEKINSSKNKTPGKYDNDE